MGEENWEFNSELEYCDCCHCHEAEEEYQQELERGYQMDILEDEINDRLKRYVDLGGYLPGIEMIRVHVMGSSN